MQKKLESFFKPSSTPKSSPPTSYFADSTSETPPQIRIKYTRQALDSRQSLRESDRLVEKEELGERKKVGVVANKKRSYAQFHLDLGQSDFLLHTCKICGINYAKGDEADEKVHATFHKNYTLGIPFKGWRHERVIKLPKLERDRVILVLNSDPPAQRKKVQEVVKMMEIEMGEGWIFHDHCKVYLFISSQRIAGCMVVETINTAHKILPSSADKVPPDDDGVKEEKPKPTVLQFGEICFRREVSKTRRSLEAMDSSFIGSILCEEEATPASCGVRAIWVSPSNRRKQIATHLLDALRQSLSEEGRVIGRSELAFSQPTSAGKALASKYTRTKSFLVY